MGRLSFSWLDGAAVLAAVAAGLATLTQWMPIRGDIQVDTATLPSLGTVGTLPLGARQGTAKLIPFERLVAPFTLVPSGKDSDGHGYVALSHPTLRMREVFDFEAWQSAAGAVYLDGDRIMGDGVLAWFPEGASPGSAPLTVAYRARITGGATAFLWGAFGVVLLAAVVARALRDAPAFRRAALASAAALFAAGASLMALNVAGLFASIRPEAPSAILSAVGAHADPWLDAATLERELERRPGERRDDHAVRMNALLAANILHVWNYANASTLRLHVPPWSNFVLWGLGEMDPRLYRYHYVAWRPAVERGFGMCAQATLALVALLRDRGYDARIVQLSGHTVVTAEVLPGTWHVFDPDVGVAIPASVDAIERNPDLVRPLYERVYSRLRHPDPMHAAGVMAGFYETAGNHVEPRGANQMMGESWANREALANVLKWLIPIALLALGGILARFARVAPYGARASRAGNPAPGRRLDPGPT